VPFFRDWGGLELGEILLLNAWFMFWNTVLEVPTGVVADRFGRRVSLLLGLAIGALGTLIYVTAPRLEVFLVAEVAMALSYALISGADEALLYDSLLASGRESEALRWMARLESAQKLGIAVGALGGAALAQWLSLRAIVALQAVPVALSVVVALALVEAPTHERASGSHSLWRVAREGLGLVLGRPPLRRLALDFVSVGAVAFLVIWLYQPLLESAGVPIAGFGLVHVALSLGQVAVLQSAGRLELLFGSRRALLLACALLAGLGWLGLGVASSPAAVVALVVLVASFGLARGPLLGASFHRHIPSERRATAISGISMLRKLAIVCVNLVASQATRASLSGTALGIGAALLVLAFAARARPEHL
jgi:MFS family permease